MVRLHSNMSTDNGVMRIDLFPRNVYITCTKTYTPHVKADCSKIVRFTLADVAYNTFFCLSSMTRRRAGYDNHQKQWGR